MKLPGYFVAAALSLGGLLRAQPPPPPPPIQISVGNVVSRSATIQMGLPEPFTLLPPPPRPALTFIAGTRMQFIAHPPGAAHGPVQWVKDGRPLTTTDATLEIASASAADTGTYHAFVRRSDGGLSGSSPALLLVVREGQRLLNVSTRARIDAAQPFFLSGLVIEPGPQGVGAVVLVRAIGPTLASFGVTGALAAPQVRMLTARGHELQPERPHSLVGDNPAQFPSVVLATQRAGAFPLAAGTRDVALLFYLPTGAYTAEVSAADGGTGTVLLEIYEVVL